MTVLLDTNVVLEHFRSGILTTTPPEASFCVSVITEAELLRYHGISEREVTLIERFLSITTRIAVDSRIARTAAMIGRARTTKLPDLLIAATALEFGVPLITKNLKDFRGIPGLIVRAEL